jgi:hypothetical protein
MPTRLHGELLEQSVVDHLASTATASSAGWKMV